jgi:hypothetical protein
VPKEYQALQKLLSLYHPDLNKRYAEVKPVEQAKDDLIDLEIEIMALNAARGMEIEQSEAILRTEIGSERKLMTVPFDENPYSALAAFFKTDEGVEIYKSISKKVQ